MKCLYVFLIHTPWVLTNFDVFFNYPILITAQNITLCLYKRKMENFCFLNLIKQKIGILWLNRIELPRLLRHCSWIVENSSPFLLHLYRHLKWLRSLWCFSLISFFLNFWKGNVTGNYDVKIPIISPLIGKAKHSW